MEAVYQDFRFILSYPKPHPWVAIGHDLKRVSRRPVIAVVAYIGVDAPKVMPLRKGDFLVCDASKLSVKQGSTSAKALLEFDKSGIKVFSVQGLHAKVIASKTFAWVGSANASTNSLEGLIEVSTKVVGSEALRILAWANDLASEDSELSRKDLLELRLIPVRRRQPGPRVDRSPPIVPQSVSHLFFVETSGPASAAAVKIASLDRKVAQGSLFSSGPRAGLTFIEWRSATPRGLKTGNLVIAISSGHVSRPSRVVRISKFPKFDLIWLEEVPSSSKASIKHLRTIVPHLDSDFDKYKLSNKKLIKSVLKLFNLY